jgi:hypothetical protein
MIKRNILIASAFFSFSLGIAQQYGGMWIPTELNEKEMKDLGMKISAKDIFNVQKPSIKDAVVQFNGGCTAEIISPKGLLLTNHHCGYGQIQAHSTVENDLLSNGFWAKNTNGELPNPGVTVDFIVDIKEVTQQILEGTDKLQNRNFQKIANNIEVYKNSQKIEPYQSISVKSMYYGNKYYAYTIETYKDIRLVGAPPQSIGKFGSDTDNWVWPRHTEISLCSEFMQEKIINLQNIQKTMFLMFRNIIFRFPLKIKMKMISLSYSDSREELQNIYRLLLLKKS